MDFAHLAETVSNTDNTRVTRVSFGSVRYFE